MTNVLIPTDFSKYSLNAIQYALDYFSKIRVNFFFLHVCSEKTEQEIDRVQENTLVQNARTIENRLVELNLPVRKNYKYFPIEEHTSLIEAVRKHVSSKNIEFIVMGTKGITGNTRSTVGSQTYEVITKIKCPILVVPENAKFDPVMNLSFVTDYNCLYKNKVLTTLSKALELHGSPLYIIKPRTGNRQLSVAQVENKEFIHHFFRDKTHSFHFLQREDLEEEIQSFVDHYRINMVAIPARNLNFIQKLMLRFSSEKVNYHTIVPFLVIHE